MTVLDPVLLRLRRTRSHLPRPEQQNNLSNAATRGRMVPSGKKKWSAARSDQGLATVALNCVLLAEARLCERTQLLNKIFHHHIIHLSELNTIERGVIFLISLYSH